MQNKYILSYVIFGIIIFIATLNLLSSDLVIGDPQEKHSFSSLFIRLLSTHWVLFVLGIGILIILAVFFSHRVAGPLYRFEMAIDKMISGDFSSHITLRKNDECKSLAEKFNQLNSILSSRIKAMTKLVDEIDNNLVNIDKAANDPGGIKGTDENLNQAIILSRRLKNILYDFILVGD